MAVRSTGDAELGRSAPTTGTFTATGASGAFYPLGAAVGASAAQDFNISLWGTFVGTVRLERSFDGGTTWLPLTYVDGSAVSWTAAMSSMWAEAERGVAYRFYCSAYTSGAINFRISQ